jgi:amino-acid N-acetyltransferase
MDGVTLEPAGDLGYVESLLAGADLPTSDVPEHPDRFYVARDGADRVGVGGVERYGADALLRSVVVEASVRGTGYGSALCDALEERAREDGVETLYLLTTTAAGFFAGRGYERIERSAVPEAVRETTEFSALCPDSATCMRREL